MESRTVDLTITSVRKQDVTLDCPARHRKNLRTRRRLGGEAPSRARPTATCTCRKEAGRNPSEAWPAQPDGLGRPDCRITGSRICRKQQGRTTLMGGRRALLLSGCTIGAFEVPAYVGHDEEPATLPNHSVLNSAGERSLTDLTTKPTQPACPFANWTLHWRPAPSRFVRHLCIVRRARPS